MPHTDSAVPEGSHRTLPEMHAGAGEDESGLWKLAEELHRQRQALTTTRQQYAVLNRRHQETLEMLAQSREIELACAEQHHALEQLQQDFLAKVSHELRTPITTILGYLSLLGQGAFGHLTPEQLEGVQIAQRNATRLERMISDLLDLSSLTHRQLLCGSQPVEVASVLWHSVAETTALAQRKGVTVKQRFSTPLGSVQGHHDRLVRIITHLLENAIKFSAGGQRVTLTARRHGGHVVIAVRDHGVGMTAEQQALAFTPFRQGESGLSRQYEGLGVGLSLTRNLVTLHGGHLTVHSVPEEGTTATVSLPLVSPEPPQ